MNDSLDNQPVEIRVVVGWMGDRGYRDMVPRRDAVEPANLTYYFVQEGRRKYAITARSGYVRRRTFEKLKIEVADEEKEHRGDN